MQTFCFWTLIILLIIRAIVSLCKVAIECSKKSISSASIAGNIIGTIITIAIPLLLLWGAGFFNLI